MEMIMQCSRVAAASAVGFAVGLVAMLGVAAAAGSVPKTAGAGPAAVTSEDLSRLTGDQVRTRVLDACVVIQADLAETNQEPYAERCGCYASRVVKDMSADEFAAFRATGVFNDSARAKALRAIDLCKVKPWF
jgi:hypothetical protein